MTENIINTLMRVGRRRLFGRASVDHHSPTTLRDSNPRNPLSLSSATRFSQSPASSSQHNTSSNESKTTKDYRYNIIGKVRYWDDAKFALKDPGDLLPNHSTLLIQRREPLTKQEIQLQRMIEFNNPRSYSLDARNLYRIQLLDEPSVVKSQRRDFARIFDRLTEDARRHVSRFRYILQINPRYDLGGKLRTLSGDSILVSIFTDDFDHTRIVVPPEDSDVIIAPGSKIFGRARREAVARDAQSLHRELVGLLADLKPKEFNILIPAFGDFQYDPAIDIHNGSGIDALLSLRCTSKDAPVVTSTFELFLEAMAETVCAIMVTEPTLQRYKSLLAPSDPNIFLFLKFGLMDGLRMSIRYDCNRTSV